MARSRASALNERRLCLFELRTCKLRKHYVTIITNNVCPWKSVSMEERGTSRRYGKWNDFRICSSEESDRNKGRERRKEKRKDSIDYLLTKSMVKSIVLFPVYLSKLSTIIDGKIQYSGRNIRLIAIVCVDGAIIITEVVRWGFMCRFVHIPCCISIQLYVRCTERT